MTISTTSAPTLNRIEIRFAQMGYLFPHFAADRPTLATLYGEYYNDELLVDRCSFKFGFLFFRQTVILLLEDIALRGLPAALAADVIYSLIRETGCTPEQALEVIQNAE